GGKYLDRAAIIFRTRHIVGFGLLVLRQKTACPCVMEKRHNAGTHVVPCSQSAIVMQQPLLQCTGCYRGNNSLSKCRGKLVEMLLQRVNVPLTQSACLFLFKALGN